MDCVNKSNTLSQNRIGQSDSKDIVLYHYFRLDVFLISVNLKLFLIFVISWIN